MFRLELKGKAKELHSLMYIIFATLMLEAATESFLLKLKQVLRVEERNESIIGICVMEKRVRRLSRRSSSLSVGSYNRMKSTNLVLKAKR